MNARFKRTLLHVVLGAVVLSPPSIRAQEATVEAVPPEQEAPPDPAFPVAQDQNARQVRGEFDRILSQHPTTVRQVFRFDPALMLNAEYLAPYPVLAAYLAQHPEIPRNPAFFVGTPNTGAGNIAEAMIAISIFVAVAGVVIWLVNTLIAYRRWSRLSRVQTEVHTKLLDRFTDSADLQAYFASAAGRRFLEAAPIDMGNVGTQSAPAGRIMWSLQVGVVLALGGAGLYAAIPSLNEQAAADPLRVVGTLAIALGIGFILSAGASFILSQRLGLFTTSGSSPGGEA